MKQVISEIQDPVEIGGIKINDAGEISRCAPDLPISFGFAWRGMTFDGEVAQANGALILRISTDVATVPFSAENTDRRQQLLSLLKASEAGPRRASIALSPNNRLVLLRDIELPRDAGLTATSLVSHAAIAVLESAPYLDLMAEQGVEPPRAAQGLSN